MSAGEVQCEIMNLAKSSINHAGMWLNSEPEMQKRTSKFSLKSAAQCRVADKRIPKSLACLEK